MYVDCLYRFYPYGEIQHGKYSTITGLIKGLPENIFHNEMDSELWSPANYKKSGHSYPLGRMEYVMACQPTVYLVIECNNLGMYMCLDNGAVEFTYGSPIESAHVDHWNNPGFGVSFKEIGYKVTTARQVSHGLLPGSMALCNEDGKIYSGGKVYDPYFDVGDCSGIRTDFKGYRDAVESKSYGVLYIGGESFLAEENISDGNNQIVLGRRI